MKRYLLCLPLFISSLFANDYLIVADAPGYDFTQIVKLKENRIVVALDGAADHMHDEALRPDVILGDFDTIKDLKRWEQHSQVTIIPAPDQNYSDLQKAVMYCDTQKATSIEIVNATGGRMDHTLGNIRFMRQFYRNDRPLYLLTDTETLEFVRDDSRILRADPGTQCAILACPKATIQTTGLAYDTDGYLLDLGLSESICNQMAASQAHITIKGEALIILSSLEIRPSKH